MRWIFHRVEVIQVAEELVEAVHCRQKLVPMARHFLLTVGNCDAGHGGLMEVKITSNFRKPSEKSEVPAGRWDIANPERQMQRAAQYWPVLCRLRFRRSMPEEHDVWMRAPWNAARALQRQPDVL
jgi:hypothetical protein